MVKYKEIGEEIDAFIWTGGIDQADPEWLIKAMEEGKLEFLKSSDGKLFLLVRGIHRNTIVAPGEVIYINNEGYIGSMEQKHLYSQFEKVINNA